MGQVRVYMLNDAHMGGAGEQQAGWKHTVVARYKELEALICWSLRHLVGAQEQGHLAHLC
jgi:hypothetical protein